jgi:hypothetical protein
MHFTKGYNLNKKGYRGVLQVVYLYSARISCIANPEILSPDCQHLLYLFATMLKFLTFGNVFTFIFVCYFAFVIQQVPDSWPLYSHYLSLLSFSYSYPYSYPYPRSYSYSYSCSSRFYANRYILS